MAKKPKRKDALRQLLGAAPQQVLSKLIANLAAEYPDVRRECFDFLKSNVVVSKSLKKQSEGEAVLALWSELAPDLEDLDMYGGGDYGTQNLVDELLGQIQDRLDAKKVDAAFRRELLDLVLPFIKSGNAGMDDSLYEITYAACYDDDDLRWLAQAFEAMGGEWQLKNARDIYRRLGDRNKYLELRSKYMKYGADYHDLATFYWESGEKEKALQMAEKGLRRAQGRMDELRGFAAERAKESGDRETFMVLQFEQATENMTLEKYKHFKKLCSAAEWTLFEPKLIGHLKNVWGSEKLKIRMHRKEYDQAIEILSKARYPTSTWEGDYEIKVAGKLEKRFPEKVLKYYLSGLGNLNLNAQRKEYARRARVMAKVRNLLVDVLDDEPRWIKFATTVKQDNLRRPAFQQEFAKVVPGWQELMD